MLSKKIMLIIVMSGFISNSFAWGYHRSYTVCRGGNCHHTSVNKGCFNGHCGTTRYGSTWHR